MPVKPALFPRTIRFAKLNAAGNDFVCLDNTRGAYDRLLGSAVLREFVRRICRRGLAVGADGVMFACPPGGHAGADIVARFLEPDGSEAELCGNGTACFTHWTITSGLVPGPFIVIATAAGMARGRMLPREPGRVQVCVPDPRGLQRDLDVEVNGEPWRLDCLDTGVPHAVAYVEDLEGLDVGRWGPGIRYHATFQPRGVNANFVQVRGVGHIAVRTYEFGVEAETLACGTGSAAAAILTCLRYNWPRRNTAAGP